MSLLVLSSSDVTKVAETFSPQALTALMAIVFRRSSQASSQHEHVEDPNSDSSIRSDGMASPLRTSISTPYFTALFMPAMIDRFGTSVKVVSVPTGKIPYQTGKTNARGNLKAKNDGLPATTLVLDETSGRVKAIVNARSLTALRTAAGSHLKHSLIV